MTGASMKLGATYLMYACQQGKESQVNEIIKTKPGTILDRERSLKTALHYCAESGDGGVESAAALLRVAPELVSAQDQDGYTALHLAVIAGNVHLAKLLIAHGADVNTQDNEGHTCAHWATVCGEIECLELILKKKGDPNIGDMHGGCPLHYAAQMCGPGSEMPADRRLGMTALRLLINHSANPNIPDNHGRQPILWAASAGSSEAILVLTNAGANVEASDKDGLTALHCAASRGHTDCVETLISLCNAEADVIDNNGCSALFYAVTLGHADCVQALLNHGANTNRQDRKGRTAMHCGAAKGQMETLKVVWNRGGNLWTRTARGDYPLHEAVTSGRCELVTWLLSLRPDTVNAPNNDGRCPLHLAAIHNNVEMCKVLLDAGSLVNPVMRTGKGLLATPLDAALHKGHRGTAKYLQLHGGVPAARLNSESAALRGPNSRNSAVQNPQPIEGEIDNTGDPVESTKPSALAHQQNVKFPDQTQKILQVYIEDGVMIKRIRQAQSGDGEERIRRRRRKRKARYIHENKGFPRDRERYRRGYEESTDDEGDASRTSSVVETRQRSESDTESLTTQHHLKESREKGYAKKQPLKTRQESDRLKENVQEVEVELHRPHDAENDSGSNNEANILSKQTDISQSVDNEDNKENNHKKSVSIDNGKSSQSDVETMEQNRVNKLALNDPSKCFTGKSEESTFKRSSEDRINSSADKLCEGSSVNNEITESSVNELSSINPSANEEEISEAKQDNIHDSHQETTLEQPQIIDGISKLELSKTEKQEDEIRKETPNSMNIENIEEREDNAKSQEVFEEQNIETKESLEEGLNENYSVEGKAECPTDMGEISQSNEIGDIGEERVNEKGDIGEEHVNEKGVIGEEHVNEEGIIGGEHLSEKGVIGEGEVNEDVMPDIHNSFEKEATSKRENYLKTESNHEINENDEYSDEVTPVLEKEIAESNVEPSKTETSVIRNIENNTDQKDSDLQKEPPQELLQSKESIEKIEDTNKIEAPATSGHVLDTVDNDNGGSATEEQEMSNNLAKYEENIDGKEVGVSNINEENSSLVEEPEQETPKEYNITENDVDNKKLNKTSNEQENSEMLTNTEEALNGSKKKERAKLSNKMKLKGSIDTSIGEGQKEQDIKFTQGKDKGLIKILSNENPLLNVNRESKTRTKRKEWKQHRSSESWEPRSISPQLDDENSNSSTKSPIEPSLLQDSGIEPSPHRGKKTKGLRSKSKSRIPRMCNKQQSDFDDDIPISTVSVTQAVQWSVRKYHLERRIFHQLLELKRLQIRAGRASESVLVKRLVDDYKRAGLMLGLQQYNGVYTFRAFERYLYDQLRILQSSERRMIPRLKSSDDLERLTSALKKTRAGKDILTSMPSNPALCTFQTHRCHHATHAYTGIPCAAYIRKNHHTMPKAGPFLPRLVNGDKTGELAKTLRFVDPSRPLTLELSHGSEKQVITLPTEKLDKSKRYFVTFTIKTGNQKKPEGNHGHFHASSV